MKLNFPIERIHFDDDHKLNYRILPSALIMKAYVYHCLKKGDDVVLYFVSLKCNDEIWIC